MEIRERAGKLLKTAEADRIGSTALQKAAILSWETGLGPVRNALPDVFGQQAVIYFPGRSGKYAFPCCESAGKILLSLNPDEMESIRDLMLQSPAVEIWLKNGWYTGTVRILTDEEKAAAEAQLSPEGFFGSFFARFRGQTFKDRILLEVTRTAPCTGNSGPGSKSWIWPLAALVLLFMKKKK